MTCKLGYDSIDSMPWIRQISDEEAQGLCKQLFAEARERAGKVWNVVRLMSLRPKQLQTSMALYREIMFGESGLTRAERELVAVVVSAINGCFY
jgi:uncharacterized peroxidase-related enzyme